MLGAIFLDNLRAYEAVSDFLLPDHFALLEHQQIYEACIQMIEAGRTADPTTLAPYFANSDRLDSIGGVAALANILESAVTVINAGHYGRIIFDLFLRRELIALSEKTMDDAYQPAVDDPSTAIIERTEGALFNLAERGEVGTGFQTFSAAARSAIRMAEVARKRGSDLAGVTTGFRDLDARLGGLHNSDLIVVAGRPGMGKTAFATNIATNAAYAHYLSSGKHGAVVGFFSLEMSSEQLSGRILSEQLEIAADRMRKGTLTDKEFVTLTTRMHDLQHLPFFIDDTPGLSINAIRSRARRLKRRHNLGLIVVDYLQLIGAMVGTRSENRVQELSLITRNLKVIAKELDVPVIAISQLSRAVEQREDKRPQLSDLRESGSIEQDADVVMFLFREEYYLRNSNDEAAVERARNLAEVDIAKHRHGATSKFDVTFLAEYTRFSDLARAEYS